MSLLPLAGFSNLLELFILAGGAGVVAYIWALETFRTLFDKQNIDDLLNRMEGTG